MLVFTKDEIAQVDDALTSALFGEQTKEAIEKALEIIRKDQPEPTFSVFVSTPYEGLHEALVGVSMDELREWFRDGRGGYDLDDIDIRGLGAPDPYELAQEVAS